MFASKDIFLAAPAGYQIQRSVRLRSSASAYFNRTAGTPTNANIWTLSAWVKRGALSTRGTLMCGGSNNVNYVCFNDSGTTDYFGLTYSNSPSQLVNVMTTQVFRDPSSWYHLMVVYDSTSATSTITGSSTDRVRLYVNGTQVTAFSATSGPAQNTAVNINAASAVLNIGRRNVTSADSYLDGYLTEINFIDGQALTPSSFGQTNSYTGVWSPLKYTGTYGTNGFYLNFSDNSSNTATTIGKDYSGNGNNWTPNNISVTAGATYDSMVDVPTQFADGSTGRGNYAVLNPLDKGAATTLTAANLNNDYSGTATDSMSFSSIAFDVASSQFFAEFTYVSSSLIGSGIPGIGVADVSTVGTGNISTTGTAVIYLDDGTKTVNGTNSSYGATWTTGDVVGVYVNSGTIVFYKNGVSQGNAATGLTGTYKFVVRGRSGTSRTFTIAANFGQRPFAYTPPSGFKALNTLNLSTPTILKGNLYMDATLYTGTGATQSITNSGSMQPDFVWLKCRSNARDNVLFDAVRGIYQKLYSNLTVAESTDTGSLTAFNSNGFTLGGDSAVNASTNTFVGWQWNAGGSNATNTSGSITSTVRASTTAGFSVVTYTGNGSSGATIGHGVGVALNMIIIKSRSSATNWRVGHSSLPSWTNFLQLDGTNAQGSNNVIFNGTAPTSTVFTVGNDSSVNSNGSTYVAYCFAAVRGFSAFGSYTGNGSADGPFVYLGFRPAFVMWKRTDAVSDWEMVDKSRPAYNVVTGVLYANLSNAEVTSSGECDFTANGFKIRDNSNRLNTSGGTYIYAAFAENPFKNALAR